MELPGLGFGGDACLGLFSSCVVFEYLALAMCVRIRLARATDAGVFCVSARRLVVRRVPGPPAWFRVGRDMGAEPRHLPGRPACVLGWCAVFPSAGVRSCVRALALTHLCLPAYGRKFAYHIIITCETRRAAPLDEGMPADRTRPRRRHGRRHSSRDVVDCCDFACVPKWYREVGPSCRDPTLPARPIGRHAESQPSTPTSVTATSIARFGARRQPHAPCWWPVGTNRYFLPAPAASAW